MALPLGSDVEFLGQNNSGGTVIGVSAAKLVGFHNATPVAQAAICSAPVTGVTVGAASSADYATLITAVQAIRTILINKGLMASS